MAGVSWWLQTQRLGFLGSGYADKLNHQLENHGLELGVSIWGKVANCYGRELILGTTQTSTLNLKGSNLEEISEKTRFDFSLGISVRSSGSEKWKMMCRCRTLYIKSKGGKCLSYASRVACLSTKMGTWLLICSVSWAKRLLYTRTPISIGTHPKKTGIVGCSFSFSRNNSVIYFKVSVWDARKNRGRNICIWDFSSKFVAGCLNPGRTLGSKMGQGLDFSMVFMLGFWLVAKLPGEKDPAELNKPMGFFLTLL